MSAVMPPTASWFSMLKYETVRGRHRASDGSVTTHDIRVFLLFVQLYVYKAIRTRSGDGTLLRMELSQERVHSVPSYLLQVA